MGKQIGKSIDFSLSFLGNQTIICFKQFGKISKSSSHALTNKFLNSETTHNPSQTKPAKAHDPRKSANLKRDSHQSGRTDSFEYGFKMAELTNSFSAYPFQSVSDIVVQVIQYLIAQKAPWAIYRHF